MKRNQFTFYRSFFEALSLLPKRVRLDTYEAIIAYALDGTEPELAESGRIVFLMAKPVLDASRAKARQMLKFPGNSPEFSESFSEFSGKSSEFSGKTSDFQNSGRNETGTEKAENAGNRENPAQTEVLNKNGDANIPGLVPSMEKETEKEPENKPEAESKPEGQAKSREDFARFWLAYPKRVNREDAFRAYMAADASPQELLAAVQRQRAGPQWREQGGRFVPQPANWLRRRGWLDEPAGVGPPPRQDATLEDLQRMQEYLKEFNSS